MAKTEINGDAVAVAENGSTAMGKVAGVYQFSSLGQTLS
jgi:hypothetical protein